eukprot:7390192-Prymnesium_polylepis.1
MAHAHVLFNAGLRSRCEHRAHAALISSPLACGATPNRSCAVLIRRSVVALSSLGRVVRASNIGGQVDGSGQPAGANAAQRSAQHLSAHGLFDGGVARLERQSLGPERRDASGHLLALDLPARGLDLALRAERAQTRAQLALPLLQLRLARVQARPRRRPLLLQLQLRGGGFGAMLEAGALGPGQQALVRRLRLPELRAE